VKKSIITVILFISWELHGQVALPTFQATHYASSVLYSFSSHTFTNCGETGRQGPTLAECKSSYDTVWENDTDLFNVVTQGIQEWTVPITGTYRIEAYGAQGGNRDGAGGEGARMRGDFSLNLGDIIFILVGQEGSISIEYGGTNDGGGGGGGTFVVKKSGSGVSNAQTADILVIAGGGGGKTGSYSDNVNEGRTTTDGGDTYNNGGGTNGGGGDDGQTNGPAAGGGGFLTDGQNTSYGTGTNGGKSFLNGGKGGTGTAGSAGDGGKGGFGGGGGGWHNSLCRSGGAGGYSGGQGGTWSGVKGGGGGGSINNGSNTSNSAGAREGHGQVIITLQ